MRVQAFFPATRGGVATETLTRPATLGSNTTKVYKKLHRRRVGGFLDRREFSKNTRSPPTRAMSTASSRNQPRQTWPPRWMPPSRGPFPKWRLVPAPRGAEIVFRAAEMLVGRKEEFSRDMTREMGKILEETRGMPRKPSTRPTTLPAKAAACSDQRRLRRCRTSSRCRCGSPSASAA